jgi:hypothetical protein
MPSYQEIGIVWSKPGVGTPVQACQSCGAIIETRDTKNHERFHEALAKLFADVTRSHTEKELGLEKE